MRDHMLVVTDVDNTIYDWVGIWAGAFRASVRVLAEKTGRNEEDWFTASRAVHLRRGATECPSLLCDLAAAVMWPQGADAESVMPLVAAAYRNHWDHQLTTYPGVREALTELAERGHVVVAYTEGDASIAAGRLARLGLAGTIRAVFGRTPLPPGDRPTWSMVAASRNCPISMDFIPREDSKPNPTGLRTIIAMCAASPQNTVYVGDNLFKDVVMAQRLGAGAVWARYGAERRADDLALLERVAHWTPQAVTQERQTTLSTVTPDVVLDAARDLPSAIAQRAMAVAAL